MKRLIISESKKLWKGRKIWISVVGIVLLSVYMCFQVYYSHDELQPILYSLKNEQGKIIDVMDLIRDRDQIIHQYAGIWNQEKENLIIKDLKERLAQYPRNQLDNQAMENEYGPNYMMYLKKEETVGLNEADIEQITNEIGKVPNYLGEGENILLRRIYTNDSYRQYLSYIYTGNFMFHENFDENIFDEWNTYLISPTVEKVKEENWEYESVSQNLNLSITQRNIYQDYLMDQIKQLPKQYDSGLPNQYMLAALSEVLLLPLFVVIILLANIFSIEKEQKTDQIIYPTSASQRKITIAKLLSGYFFAIGLMLLPILIVYMFSTIVFPIHCWDLLVTLLDFKSIDLLIPTTYLTLLINAILLSLISTIAIATLTMFLSYFMKNRFVVIVMMFVFMLVGMVTSVIYIQADWFHIFSFSHPFCMVLYQSYFSQTSMLWGMPIDFGVPYLFNETMVIPVRWIVMGGWVILSLFLSSWIYINSRKILLLKFSQT